MTASVVADPGRQAIIDALQRHHVNYVVIGAAAAEALGWSGRSEDIDIAPENSGINLDRLAEALNELDAKLIGDPAYPDGLPAPGGFDARLLATKQVWNLMTAHGQLDVTTDPSSTVATTTWSVARFIGPSPEPPPPSPSQAPGTSSPARPQPDGRRTSRCCPRSAES